MLVCGLSGTNVLRFQEIGNPSNNGYGSFIDEVSLDCDGVTQCLPTPSPPSQLPQIKTEQQPPILSKFKFIVELAFQLPASSIAGLKYCYLFAEDLWLYHYGKVKYEGVINTVFNVTATIQSMKSSALDKVLHWQQYSDSLPLSQYVSYARKEFVQIEGSSSVVIKALFPYFIYAIPENILTCTFLYFLFRLLSRYKISQYVRKFYFFRSTLLQSLLEGNVAYFVYVSFAHLATSFTFNFYDKLSLLFSVGFLWVVVMFSFAYYPLVGHFLKQKSGYFIYCYYRCNAGYFFVTMKNLTRNFMRGLIFYLLYQFYACQLFILSLVQVLVIVTALCLESTKKIFVSKMFYSLFVIYHGLFIFLNFSLYLGYLCDIVFENPDIKQIILNLQQLLIYLLIANLLLIIIIDFLPLNFLRLRITSRPTTKNNDLKPHNIFEQNEQNLQQHQNKFSQMNNLAPDNKKHPQKQIQRQNLVKMKVKIKRNRGQNNNQLNKQNIQIQASIVTYDNMIK